MPDFEGVVPRILVADELAAQFDVVVSMNQHETVARGQSIVTYGLGGCIAGYIDNPNSKTLFHYDPFGVPIIESLTRNLSSKQTTRVCFFVPGQWGRIEHGKYTLLPKDDYRIKLATTVQHLESVGIPYTFHCYELQRKNGNDYMARMQGTAWVDKDGKVFSDGMPRDMTTIAVAPDTIATTSPAPATPQPTKKFRWPWGPK